MAETEQKARYLKFTPEQGFDLEPIYIKDVAEVAKTSPRAVKEDMVILLRVLPLGERVVVLENLERARAEKRRREAGG